MGRGYNREFGVARIQHQYTDLSSGDAEIVDYIADRGFFAYFLVGDLEPVVAKKGEEFNGNLHLKIPKGVNLLPGEIESEIVRWQRFGIEEFRQCIVDLGEPGCGVEGPLGLEDIFAEVDHIVAGERKSEAGINKLDECRQTFGIVEGGKGDKEAHAG
jgi:hypothetical protein